MSAFNGRRPSNMFSNIANLNALPSEYELAMQQGRDSFDLEADLAMFTNTQFFDFDVGQAPDSTPSFPQQSAVQSVDFLNSDFTLTDFSSFPTAPQLTSLPQETSSLIYQQPISSPTAVSRSPSVSVAPRTGEKRKADVPTPDEETPVYLDEAARAAAEEDKRRRNTAASARFRVKKKQREQAMEKTAKDMTDRVTFLENRVAQLEMENKLLKDLITEKSSGKVLDLEELQHKVAQGTADSSRSGVRKGVGTVIKIE